MVGASAPMGTPGMSGWSIFRQFLRNIRFAVTIRKRVDVDFSPARKERREIEISVDIGSKD